MNSAAVERALRAFFARQHGDIVAAYLFGSVAREASQPGSDVDVGVLYRDAPPLSFAGLPLDLEAELERRLGAPVQIVVLNRAPADLIHRVLRDGRLLLDRDPVTRIRFELKARNEFFDLQPILARYRAGGVPRR